MGIKLDPRYQEEGYREVKRTLKETKRAGIILPPGAGKSYIALKWIEDSLEENGQILYVSPSPTINARIRKIIRQNYDKETAQRMVDFLSGAAFALDGMPKKVSGSTFLFSSSQVDLEGQIMEAEAQSAFDSMNDYNIWKK